MGNPLERMAVVFVMRTDPRLSRKLKYARKKRFSWREAWHEAGIVCRSASEDREHWINDQRNLNG